MYENTIIINTITKTEKIFDKASSIFKQPMALS